MNQAKLDIKQFIHALSDMPKSDPLVHIPTEHPGLVSLHQLPQGTWEETLQGKWKSLWQTATQFRQESDVQSLCLTYGTITWNHNNQELQSPLFLVPLHWEYHRLKNSISLELQEANAELNPFVKFLLTEWNINSESTEKLSDESGLEEQLEAIKTHIHTTHPHWEISSDVWVGNFHYHRYHLLRELEGINQAESLPQAVQQLLGGNTSETIQLHLSKGTIVPADKDQQHVFKVVPKQNTLVHGPPGTGKSQVLINLIGKSLASELRTLVVSEKRVALEVLVKKLAEFDLDQHAFIFHSQAKAKDFIQQLKHAWIRVEEYTNQRTNPLYLTEQLGDGLQLLLDRLNAPNYFAGISYQEIQQLQAETPFKQKRFSSKVPDLKSWVEVKPVFVDLSTKWNGLQLLHGFNAVFFENWNGDQILVDCIRSFQEIKRLFPTTDTLAQVEQLAQSIGRCQLVENEYYKVYSQLAQKPREWKKFLKLVSEFKHLSTELKAKEQEIAIWKTPPSPSQIQSWEQASGWFERRKRKKAIANLLHDRTVDPLIAIENWKERLQLLEKSRSYATYFEELGLQASVHELDLGIVYASHLSKESTSLLNEIAQWSSAQRQAVIAHSSLIQSFLSKCRRYFFLSEENNIDDFFKTRQNAVEHLLAVQKQLKTIPAVYFELIQDCSNWEELQELLVYSNWKKVEALNPELVQFTGTSLEKRLDEYLKTELEECTAFVSLIKDHMQSRFEHYHTLLRTPSAKLNTEQKLLKRQLKQGKALLVKEFAKSKSHVSIRHLLHSDAAIWIQCLVPVFLSTPSQVASYFPLQQSLFDLVLFDEASQIPLPHALGSCYRSQRVLVAGDDQQMSPSSFFGKNFGFIDLLSQSMYYFKRVNLRHHYRSAYTDLISFSNEHFYNNELIVYPSSEQRKVLFHHPVENGIYHNRRNNREAQEVAQFLTHWNKWQDATLGIVAFSEEQLKAIWEACSAQVQERISAGMEANTVFFKALEHVQGDEADILVISLGYAKNEASEFSLRFGPLNASHGYKRLNVLLTRAKNELHFFTSIHSTEFKFTANESVRLLCQFLRKIETHLTKNDPFTFPFGLHTDQLKGSIVHFKHIYSTISDAEELITFHRVMKQRGWKLVYETI